MKTRPVHRFRLFAAAALFAVAASPNAPAADLTIDGGTVYPYASGTTTYDNILVGNTGVGTLNQSGGTLTASNFLELGVNSGSNGTYTLSGNAILMSAEAALSFSGVSVFTQSGGTYTVSDVLTLGYNPGGNATYNLQAGGLSTGRTYVGNYSTGLFAQTGGTFTTNGQTLSLGEQAGGSGTYNLQAGSLSTGQLSVGTRSVGVFTQSGTSTVNTNGSTVVLAMNSGGSGTYNLNGGTLTAGGIAGGNGATSAFNFNGGTFQATANASTTVSALSAATVQTGGAKFDTNGGTIAVSQALLHDATLGTTADGGLTKLGAGTLTLSVASTYTGATTVNAGTLAISANGGLGKGNVTIAAGGTLTLAAGVTAAHNASTGTTLTLAATSTINLNATTPGTTQDTYGAIVIAGVSQLLPGTYGSATSGAAHVFPEFTGNGEILLAAVPEPGTWALLGVGAAGLGLAVLRRRPRAA